MAYVPSELHIARQLLLCLHNNPNRYLKPTVTLSWSTRKPSKRKESKRHGTSLGIGKRRKRGGNERSY
jgi:hypothetical protein